MSDRNDQDRAARIENALGSRGVTLTRKGSNAERLQAAASAVATLGFTVEPTVDGLEAALAALGTADLSQFDTPAQAAERRARVEREQAEAAKAQAAAQAKQEAARKRAELEQQVAADVAARELRLADLEAKAQLLAADAEQKAAEAQVIAERAAAAQAELDAVKAVA